jgi:cob(I)alamin adenosyltransferase
MAKIYTRRGDSGETDLIGGTRVPKDDLRIAALGEVDELNAAIGLAMAVIEDRDITAALHRVQNDLFTVGADLSVAPGKELKLPKVTKLSSGISRS